MKILAERMRELRIDAGLSQKAAAKSLEISYPSYCRYEYDQRDPMAPTIAALARLYHVSADYLLGLSDSK